ncbi:MAG: hypothetical protein JWL77_3850 [Chthonomonadaceae bacterium]|nr:hypothetical protein [Chthonomonadaceae bacterium]
MVRRGILTSFVFCALVSVTGLSAIGQVQAASSLPSVQFCSDLEILSRRLRVAFVVEGEPVFVNKDVPVPSLKEPLPPEDAVQEVAAYFDYKAVRQGSAYFLTKRYTDPADMPDVTSEECRAGLRTITRMLGQFNPKIPGPTTGSPQATIATLLSSAQLETLGKDGLPVSELTSVQRAEVEKLALEFFIQSDAEQCEQLLAILESRNPSAPVFHWQTLLEVHAFGYDARSASLNKVMFFPVSDSHRVRVSLDGIPYLIKGQNLVGGKPVAPTDPTDPEVLAEPMKRFLDDRAKSSRAVALSDVIAALNGRPDNHVVYKVDAMYASKHVTLIGSDKLPGDALMRGVAAVYGLRAVHNEDGSFVLTHPAVIAVNRITELGHALTSAIPAPIYRRIQAGVPTVPTHNIHLPVDEVDYQSYGSALYRSALQTFRYLVQPQVKAQPEARLLLSKMDDRARNLFEFAQNARMYCLASAITVRPMPPYIADLDHVTLTGGMYRNDAGEGRFSLFFSYTNPKTGVTSHGDGFNNAIVPH